MTMIGILRPLLLLTLLLSACSPNGLTPEAPPPTLAADSPVGSTSAPTENVPTPEILPVSTTEVVPPLKQIATQATPHIDQPADGPATPDPSSTQPCGYQWAYQDLPDLSSQFLQSLQQLQPAAQGNAFAFGENCVHMDGSATFLPMETDFNITLQASDLSNDTELGDWLVKVMQIIENIPPEQIVGPRPGRVSLTFQSGGEQTGLSFYLDQYRALEPGLTSAEIYQALKPPQ